ncbi:MAG: ABC transporter substrate-binding protein [Fibrobacterota bacterium]
MRKRYILFILSVLLGAGAFLYFRANQPLGIAVMGSFSRTVFDVSVDGRDGALLAMEEINEAGGIAGRSITPILLDDQENKTIARQKGRRIRTSEIPLVIGPFSSAMTLAAGQELSESGTLIISPTTNSPKLEDRRDNIITIIPPASALVRSMDNYISSCDTITRVAILYNSGNRAYAEPLSQNAEKIFEQSGITVTGLYPFESPNKEMDSDLYIRETEAALAENPQALILFVNYMDALLIIKSARRINKEVLLIGGDATCNMDLIESGGTITEGFITFQSYNLLSTAPAYQRFYSKFTRRFGYQPNFAAVQAYNAVSIMKQALLHDPSPSNLKKTILSTGKFDGLTREITFNAFGDNTADYIPFIVQNGALVHAAPNK